MEFRYPSCCCVCLGNAEQTFDISCTHYQTFSQGSVKTILSTSAPICRRCWRKVTRRRILGLGAGAIGLLPGAFIIFLAFRGVLHPLWFIAGILAALALPALLFRRVAKEPAEAHLMKTPTDYRGYQDVVVMPRFHNPEYEGRFKAMNQGYLSQLTKHG